MTTGRNAANPQGKGRPIGRRIAVVGAGAAGLMAAAAAAEAGPSVEVVLIERNEAPGRKVLLTGGGRCNLTTGLSDIRDILKRYPRGGAFLNSAMRRFSPAAVRDWFESRGVPLKEEADRRVFPQSDRSQDVVDTFLNLFRELGNVHLMLNSQVVRAEKSGRHFLVWMKGQPEPLRSDRLIITTGGQAFAATGSTGDGYSLARSFGHSVTPLAASLGALRLSQRWPGELAGVSFPEVRLSAPAAGASAVGPFVFTHRGISGPAVFALSAHLAFREIAEKRPLEILIDFFPEEDQDSLFERLFAFARANPAKRLNRIMSGLLPESFSATAVRLRPDLPWDGRLDQAGRREIRQVAAWLKGVPVKAVGRSGGAEFVTAGGVDLTEFDPSSMESKIVPGLHFAGEVLDVDALTGGFNLQAAWCTGRLAGESAASSG